MLLVLHLNDIHPLLTYYSPFQGSDRRAGFRHLPKQRQCLHVPKLKGSRPLEDDDEVVLQIRDSNHLDWRFLGDLDGRDTARRHVDERQLVFDDV